MANPDEAHPELDDNSGFVEPGEIDCRAALFELYQFLDGELPDPGYRRIEHHLRRCAPCLSSFDFEQVLLRLVRRHMGTAANLAVPPLLVNRVTSLIEFETRQLPDGRWSPPT